MQAKTQMDQFLNEDKETISYYIRKYCPSLPFKKEYIEPKLKPILDRLIKTDVDDLYGLFWPCFDDLYDRAFCALMEKKGVRVEKSTITVDESDEPYDFIGGAAFDHGDIRLVYAARPGQHVGFLVKEDIDDKEYSLQSSIIMDDLYKSANFDGHSIQEKKKGLLNLLRYIDSTRLFVEKTWPNIPIRDELLNDLIQKFETYDEMYDECAMNLL